MAAPARSRSSFVRRALAASFGVLTLLGPLGREREPLAATSPVVATVGTIKITAEDLARRIASLPSFQLKNFGATPDAVRLEFLKRVLVREALLSQGAEAQHLADRDDVRDRIRGVLRTAYLNHLRAESSASIKVSDADVKAYYDANSSKFHTPERYALWIIVTRTQEDAKEVLAELKKDPSPKRWNELTRLHSIDGASASRGGNVGFVQPDGSTGEAGVKIGPNVMETVKRLKDAEIAPEPVRDGNQWVVVWRKQTAASVTRGLDTEAPGIRSVLLHARTDAKVKEIVAERRKELLTDYNPDLVDLFDITPLGDMTPVRRPGSLPQGRRLPAMPIPGHEGR